MAEYVYEKELLVTNLCQPPRSKKDVEVFVATIQKIGKNA